MRKARSPHDRRKPTTTMRARLRPRPQAALALIQLASHRPEPLADRVLVDHTITVLQPLKPLQLVYLRLGGDDLAVDLQRPFGRSGPGKLRRASLAAAAEIPT